MKFNMKSLKSILEISKYFSVKLNVLAQWRLRILKVQNRDENCQAKKQGLLG